MSAPIVEIIAKPTNEVLKCKQVAGSGTLNRMDPSSPSDFSLDSGFDSPSSSFPSSPESWHLTNTAALFPTLPARTPEHTPEDSVPPKASQKSSVQEDRAEAQADARVSPDTSNCAQSSTSLCASETLSQCSFEVSSDSAKHIDERYYIQCEWSGCQKAVLSDNDLYDHVLVEHIKVLQGLQKNGEESKAPAEGDGGEDNRFGCKWGACEMNLTRGDDSKKFEWLKEHFASRHVPHAQTFFCLYSDCKARFTGKRSLQEHLRLTHDRKPKPAKRAAGQAQSATAQAPKSCMVWVPQTYCRPKDRENDFLDPRTMSWVYIQTLHHAKMTRPVFVASHGTSSQTGAKYRKVRRMTKYILTEDDRVTDKTPDGPSSEFTSANE